MRTYKEPKRIDKPRVREPGIVNPDYVNRIAASYHQKNNVIPDGSSNNDTDPSGTNHHCDDVSSPKSSEDSATCTIQEELTPGTEKDEAENVQCKDLDNGLGEGVSPISDDNPCGNEIETESVEKSVLSLPSPPECRSEILDQVMNNVISEKTDIEVSSPHSNNTATKKRKTTKPKPKQSENSDTKKSVKATKKKSSPKTPKAKDLIHSELKDAVHSELNGTDELKEDIDVTELITHDPSPPKKKKSNKSLPSKKTEKKTSKSKEKVADIENVIEDLNVTEKDDLDTSSRSDASSPRVSKRTPKRNRKYHSEEEDDWPIKEDSESGKKKDNISKSPGSKKSPIRKRKLPFEDDEIEEEEEVMAAASPEEVIVKKPVKKKRKKKPEEQTKSDEGTIGEKDTAMDSSVVEDAETKPETVQKKVKKPKKKAAAKSPKTAVNENIPPMDIANGVNNVNNGLDKTSQESKVLATDPDGIEPNSSENRESVDTKSNTIVNKKVDTPDVKKKKKVAKKTKVTPAGELKTFTDVKDEEGSSSEVKKETNQEACDKPDVNPSEVKKKTPKKKKNTVKNQEIKNQESVSDEKKDVDIKEESLEKVEDSAKEAKEENEETEKADGNSQLPAIPVVKRPPVVITCQHCGHVSHSKGANTRHLRKCVVSILKGEGPMSPTRASSSGIESGDKTNGPAENGEDIKDVKTTMLLQNQEIKKIETGTAGEAQYKCQHCSYATPKRAMLARHMRTHGIYVCLRCTFISDTHDSLKDHCHREHKDRTDFKLCRKCSRYVKCTEVTLEKHMEECAGPVPFICTHCSKEFKYESSLKSHIIRHNPDAPKRFHCEKCSYESNYKANLKKHMANIHGEKVKHVRCVHPDCEKMFYTEDSMRRHLKWHSEERPFKCPNCDKRFKTNTALRGHKVIHDPSRPFKCNINDCTKDFRSKKHLKNHQEEFHQIADKKFMCSQEACTFAFFKRSHLERHLITHTGERKFGCRICGRAFRHADNLKIHMRQHTNEKPVKCDLCDFACRQKSSLQYHLRKFHNIIPPSKEASNHAVAIDGVRKPASATVVSSASGQDSNGSQLQDKKPLSPINRSQNPMDLYEFKSDDEMDSDALLPLFQDKSLKSFRVNSVDKSENQKPVVMEDNDPEQDAPLDVPTDQENEEKPGSQESHDDNLPTGQDNVKEEQKKPETTKKKAVKKKKKAKVVKENEKVEEEVAKSTEEIQDSNVKDDAETEEVIGPADVADDMSETVTEVVKPKPKGKGKGKKKSIPKGTSPKAAASKGTPPKATSPKGTKTNSPKSATPKSSTPKASTPKSSTPKSPKAAVSKAAASKAAKGKKTPAAKKGRKAKVEPEDEPPAIAETKPAPKRSPRTKAAASKKGPGGRKKPKAKKKKKEPEVAEDLDETDEYREDDDEEEEKEKTSFDLSYKDNSKEVEDIGREEDLGDPAFVDVIKYVEEHSMLSESDKQEQPPPKEADEESLPAVEESDEKPEEDVEENALDVTATEKSSKEEEEIVTETVTDPAVAVTEPLSDIQSKVDEESDRMSSGIDTDFEEELKPPPAPRPPPVVDSDEADIESGPEDIDTPGRDFESTPPKSVANSENIHSVQSHSGGEPRLESDFGDNISQPLSQPYRRSESQPDSGSEVKRDCDPLNALTVGISKTEPDDLSKQAPLADGVAPSVVAAPTTGDFGGSQSESTMPEVDKEYLGQYLQQFDSTTRSEDEVSRLDRLDTTADRAIDIPPTPQDKDLPPLNLSATAPPLNLTTTPEIPSEEIPSQPVQGTDMSNKRMEILECDRQHENHYQPSRSVSPLRPSERIPDNVYDSLSAITSYIPTQTPTPSTRETPVIRQTENIFPPVTASTSTTSTSSSFMRFTENDALLQRQRMTTPFLAQSDPNALQNLHRMADSALASHSNSASSLLRRPTTVPPREDMFPGPTAQTMARNPFNSWAGVAGQEVRPAHWSQTPYLQRDRPANSTSSPLFSKDNYLMFDHSRRSVAERNMFPGLTQSTTRPEIPHETFPMERFDFGYFGSHGYPTAPSLQEYTRTQCGTTQKTLEEQYRRTASGITDFPRAFPQTSTSEMFSSINMNTSFNLDKYMYNREPIYHPQHMGDSTNSPFLPHGVAPQHTMFDRDYPPRGFYQNSPYSFVNSMNDKQYAAAAAASAKLTHPTGSGVTQERDFVPRPNTGAAAAPDNQIQDPYRNPLLYNMMNRYTFE
ncbi:uncharacterized protein [Argopecten irradians]|uniref:uncharacterized protein n=1 Tax=Argopecten irradians TaxID=31199 RepID=UPI00370F8B2C